MKNYIHGLLCSMLVLSIAVLQFPAVYAQNEEELIVEEELIEEPVEEVEEIEEIEPVEEEESEEMLEEFEESEETEYPAEEEQAEEQVEEFIEEPVMEEAGSETTEESLIAEEEYLYEEPKPVKENFQETTIVPGEYYEYTIVKGDCLWFIADRFYQDPFLWPEIYKANPYIEDPHWIYPDDKLLIPGIEPEPAQVVSDAEMVEPAYEPEEFMAEPVEAPVEEPIAEPAEGPMEEMVVQEEPVEDELLAEDIIEEELEEEILDEIVEIQEEVAKGPEEQTREIVPESKKYVSSSFVAPLDWQFDGYVIGEVSQKLMVSQGDDIYIDIGHAQGMRPSSRCIVYRAGRKIKDGTTGKVLGRVVRKIAIVQAGFDIEANVSTARVLTSYDYIKPGDMVRIVSNQ
ncbi:MAG: LysM peptidoglycan-binding domain-containing protein [Elusimicrobia bacterium]|nr:LysM peptidoglycan-binding domain-containing protein [Elusimicrobiota bacterium]